MTILPFSLKQSQKVLIIGAGGGFDFLCGLPIALELEEQGINVFFGNLSFTNLKNVKGGVWQSESLLRIDSKSILMSGTYFPELYLAKWYQNYKNKEINIWCLQPQGVIPTRKNYNIIISENQIDTVICVDGGVDGIFRGDEIDLGTPSMDASSVIASSLCNAQNKYYVCTAFGIEGAESGVSHAQVLNRMADLIAQNAMVGVGMLLKNSRSGLDFIQAANFIHGQMEPNQQSTIVSSIISAMNGAFGRISVNAKTQERQPWISPLTAIYWYFQAEPVATMKLFYNFAQNSNTIVEIATAIEKIRQEISISPYKQIPL